MDNLDIIIIVSLVILFLLAMLKFWPNNNKSEQFAISDNVIIKELGTKKKTKRVHHKNKESEKYNGKVNKYIIEQQFHNDYRDTLNAFVILSPSKRIFNPADLPVTVSEDVKLEEVIDIVESFIKEVNNNVKIIGSDKLGLNTWFDYEPRDKGRDGWEDQNKRLGIPGSVYDEPAKRAHIKLVNIEEITKESTEDEIRYIIYMVVQKQNVADQMDVRVNFVISKRDIDLEREFFSKGNNFYEASVKIEDIFVNCFLSNHDFGSTSALEDYHNFDNIKNSNQDITDDKEILQVLMKKKQDILREQNAVGILNK
jgi:hypothetical protein